MTSEDLSVHLLDGIDAVVGLHERHQSDRSRQERGVDALSELLSRPLTMYVAVTLVLVWVIVNAAALTMGWGEPDAPPFYYMQAVMCFGALVTALVVAAAQRRAAVLAEMRAQLDLQVNLLAEKKLAKVISLLEELRRDLPNVHNRVDAEAQAMSKPADPAQVVEALGAELDKVR